MLLLSIAIGAVPAALGGLLAALLRASSPRLRAAVALGGLGVGAALAVVVPPAVRWIDAHDGNTPEERFRAALIRAVAADPAALRWSQTLAPSGMNVALLRAWADGNLRQPPPDVARQAALIAKALGADARQLCRLARGEADPTAMLTDSLGRLTPSEQRELGRLSGAAIAAGARAATGYRLPASAVELARALDRVSPGASRLVATPSGDVAAALAPDDSQCALAHAVALALPGATEDDQFEIATALVWQVALQVAPAPDRGMTRSGP